MALEIGVEMGDPGLFWRLDKQTQINLMARYRMQHQPPAQPRGPHLRKVAHNIRATSEALEFFGPEVK